MFQLPDFRFVLNEPFWFGEGQCMLGRQRIWLCIPDKWEQSSLCWEEVVLSDGVWWQYCCSSRVGQVRITQLVPLRKKIWGKHTKSARLKWSGHLIVCCTWLPCLLSLAVTRELIFKENGVLCKEPGNHHFHFRLCHPHGVVDDRHCWRLGFSKALDGIFSVMHY